MSWIIHHRPVRTSRACARYARKNLVPGLAMYSHPFQDSRIGETGVKFARRRTSADEGVALILVLLAMLIMSGLAAAIVYTARAETFSSANYRLETEADYVAKAGIQRATNWFRSNHYQSIQQGQASTYYKVTSTGSPYNLFTSNTSPVLCVSGCSSSNSAVQLIGYGSGSTNFPSINNTQSPPKAVTAAFSADLVNQAVNDVNGTRIGTFSVRATLLNFQTVGLGTEPPYTMVPVETWTITSQGTLTDSTGNITFATAEEASTIQPIFIPTWGNALYGFCNVSMIGSAGTCTDAFNSAYGAFGNGTNATASGLCTAATGNAINAGANVGANGSVSLGSNVTVGGNVVVADNPPSGCTPCTTTAPYYCGSSTSVSGQVITGPTKAAPPAPSFRSSFPGASPSYSLGTNAVQVIPVGATWSNSPFPQTTGITPATSTPCMDTTCNGTSAHPYEIGSVSMTGGGKGGNAPILEFVGSSNPAAPIYYDIDSLSQNQGTISVSGYVVLQVKSGLSIGGNGISNGISSDIPPEYLEINYAGTTAASINGNGAVSAVINAPNATVNLGGGGSGGYFIGAIQAGNVSVQGGYPVHYDLQLSRMGGTMGVITTTAYSRQKM